MKKHILIILLTVNIHLPTILFSQSIASGGRHSLSICADSTVRSWGYNGYGQLGIGTIIEQHKPTAIAGLTSVKQVAGGLFHSLFLRSNGTVWSCGRNPMGNLGDGSNINKTTPVQVVGITNSTQVAGGGEHSLFVRGDGTAWAGGLNSSGQLGIGNTTYTNTPIQVTGLTGIICAIVLCNSAPKSYSQTNNNLKAMDTTLKMQCEVKGEGTPIVLVPGGLTGWNSWEPFVEIFTAKQKTVIRVQLLNVQYGIENRPLPPNYSVKTESSALAATLDSLGYTMPIDLVAWSYGALTSLGYALDHPDRVRTLTLIEPPAIWVLRAQGPLDEETQHTVTFFETLHGDITEDMLAAFLNEAGFVKPRQSARDLPQWNNWVPFRQSLRNSPFLLTQRDDLKRLKSFQPPVLLVKGTGSAPFLHNIIDRLAANLPHARVIEMPAGHAPHIVSMDKFLLELVKFQNESDK